MGVDKTAAGIGMGIGIGDIGFDIVDGGAVHQIGSCDVDDGTIWRRQLYLIDKEGFAVDRAIVQKRIDRMYDNVNRSKNVLFVLETSFVFDEALIKPIHDALKEAFPDTGIDLRVMQFGGESLVDADIGPHIHFTRHIRPSSLESEVYGTAAEWNWLDELRLANRPKAAELRKHNLIVKWKYSLWKALGKSLQKDGAGCVSLVLP